MGANYVLPSFKVSPDVSEEFQKLKDHSLSFIIFNLSKDRSEIIVEESGTGIDWDEFQAKLPETECRWAVYDFAFVRENGVKDSKLAFISWFPDSAGMKASFPTEKRYLSIKLTVRQQRILFSSSRDTLRRSLAGIGTEIQGTDYSEMEFSNVLGKVSQASS
ncbi:hypothetical protein HG530_009729 [Fusarium avenaceum]|nr:hypothetical protein HG530_009729 [Fusarium avenaceum]